MSEKNTGSKLPDWIATHIQLYRNDPDQGHMWDSAPVGGPGLLPTLLLHTVGRKSGRASVLPLIYKKVNNGFVIIASKGGAPAHPAWYLNLVAHPEVSVQVAAERFRAVARTATGTERDALWKQMVGIYAPYTEYQARTEREIPVVVLERVGT